MGCLGNWGVPLPTPTPTPLITGPSLWACPAQTVAGLLAGGGQRTSRAPGRALPAEASVFSPAKWGGRWLWQPQSFLMNSATDQQGDPLPKCKLKLQGYIFFNIFFLISLFICLWLHWVFVAARGLSLVVASRGYSSLRCAGFSLRWLLLLRSTGSRLVGFSSCGSWAQ